MPIHEYVCRDCAREFETLVRSDTVPRCPQCQGTDLDKKLSVFSTAGASAAAPEALPCGAPCGSCGHPDGPGACALQ